MLHRSAYLWFRSRRVCKFLRQTRETQKVQHQVLMKKIRQNGTSQFGREHGLSDVSNVADFRRRMPITTYEDYRSHIDRVKTGNLSAMFGPRTRLLMFALTSGTTKDSKFIPVTKEFFREYREGWNLWGVSTFCDHWDLTKKKTIQLSSDWQQFYTESGIPCGNISGLAAATAPRISNPFFILPKSIVQIRDSFSKQYTALRLSMATPNVGMIITANPSTLVEFSHLSDRYREQLIRDIHDGTLSSQIEIPPHVRSLLESRCRKPRRQRARELDHLAEKRGNLSPRDFWPNLSVLAVWTGGSVGAYLPRLTEHFGDVAFRDHGLSASEGRMTIPFQDGDSAGVLDYRNHYFEFVPVEEHGSVQPTILEGHELEIGHNYFVLLTTSSGFYRYDIHDVVQCVAFQGTAPILKFLNKGSYFSSITGEKLSEFQVVTAVQRAFELTGIPIEHFTAAPVFGDPPGYTLLLESGSWQRRSNLLARRVDQELSEMNCEYANRLATHRLKPLEIQAVSVGTWQALRQKRISRLGGSLEQYKHPCLINDLDFVDSIGAIEPAGAMSIANLNPLYIDSAAATP